MELTPFIYITEKMYKEKNRDYIRKILKEIEPALLGNKFVCGISSEEITINKSKLEGIVISVDGEITPDELLKNLDITYHRRVPFYRGIPIKIEVSGGIEFADYIIK